MKSMRRILIACATVAIVAGSAFAQLSPVYRDWAKGPAQFIMTPQELTQWNQIKTDADAKAFTDLFWARRDPSPGTPANEYRDAFEAAVKYADEHFAEGRRKGSLTDRGRVLVLLGAPSRIEKTGSAAATTMPGEGGRLADQAIPTQIWVYDAGKSPVLGQQAMRIAFADQFGNNTWSIQRGTGTDIADLTAPFAPGDGRQPESHRSSEAADGGCPDTRRGASDGGCERLPPRREQASARSRPTRSRPRSSSSRPRRPIRTSQPS